IIQSIDSRNFLSHADYNNLRILHPKPKNLVGSRSLGGENVVETRKFVETEGAVKVGDFEVGGVVEMEGNVGTEGLVRTRDIAGQEVLLEQE
ncbi:643_t:CDS:2, partial [Racocetra persica]